MREVYAEKKLRNLVFRLMPNHSRSLPKEQAVRQEDLEALRNHHSLLSILDFVSPPSCRPWLRVVRDMIHVESSHRQACHISIRTWADIVTFQLSTQEPPWAIELIVDWYNGLLSQVLRQHSLARKEVEGQGDVVSEEFRESMIAINQRQVGAVLSDLLESLRRAIVSAQTPEAASVLLTPGLKGVFTLFNVRYPRINGVLTHALMLWANSWTESKHWARIATVKTLATGKH
jgi:Mus7/MMS22 family